MTLTREETAIAEDLSFRQLSRNYMARCNAIRAMHPEDQAEVSEQQEAETCPTN